MNSRRLSLLLRTVVILAFGTVWFTCAGVYAVPSVSNVVPNSTVVGKYDKFEISFDVDTVATNPYWPYDPSPAANTPEHPNAVPAGVGVSVDGLFLPPGETDWNKAVVQPGFYMQDYEYRSDYSVQENWIYPTDRPRWRIRFAPTALGQWRYRIQVVDAGGSYTYDSSSNSFECVNSENRGFVRVSNTDSRYFELSDGSYLPLIGLSYNTSKISEIEPKFAQLKAMGINLLRPWWQSSGVDTPFFGAGGQGGSLVWHNIRYSTEVEVPPGRLAVAKLDRSNNGESWNSLFQRVSVKPSATYRVSARVKTVGLVGGGLHLEFSRERLTGNNDWQWISHDFTVPRDWTTMSAAVCMDNVTDGAAYVSDVSLKEVMPGGQLGPELLAWPDLQPHITYPQHVAWIIDRQVDAASRYGIYLRPVVQEKQDIFFGRITADGSFSASVAPDADNVYASADHACRTYQTYYWRYLIARWGYSTAIHSFEFVNEGDPFSGKHLAAVLALQEYLRTNDPNKHLVSTSNWHSLPPSFWRSAGDCADMHMYVGWGVASGGNRILSGWDGCWSVENHMDDINDLGDGFSFDTAVRHSGNASLRIDLTASPGTPAHSEQTAKIKFLCGLVPGHRVRLSLWVKADNLIAYPAPEFRRQDLMRWFNTSGNDYPSIPENACPRLVFPVGTYDWTLVSEEFIVPQGILMLGVIPRRFCTNSDSPGTVWIDDLVVEDLDTGIILNYNGGFEDLDPMSYDVVAGHCAYSHIARGYQLGKPVIRGEIGFTHPQRYTNPYQGFSFSGEDQDLIKDTQGLWWKKFIWAQIDAGALHEIYWMYHLPVARNYRHGKAFQDFMAGIPLSNGHYEDARAVASTPNLRVLGQKDLVNNRAHLWIDNKPCTWKNIVDGKPIDPVSGTVTVSGFRDGNYKVEWWDTTAGSITSTEDVVCSGGNITLTISNLSSDVACKIRPVAPSIRLSINVPSEQVRPGETVTVTVGYENVGDAPGVNVQVKATVPEQMDFVSAEQGGQYDAAERSVTWIIPSVAAGERGTKTFQARVK